MELELDQDKLVLHMVEELACSKQVQHIALAEPDKLDLRMVEELEFHR